MEILVATPHLEGNFHQRIEALRLLGSEITCRLEGQAVETWLEDVIDP
jgi:hypothetical protein